MNEGEQEQEHVDHDENTEEILEEDFIHVTDICRLYANHKKCLFCPDRKAIDRKTEKHRDQQQADHVLAIDEAAKLGGMPPPPLPLKPGGYEPGGKRG